MSRSKLYVLAIVISLNCLAPGLESHLSSACTPKSGAAADDPETFAWRLFACLNRLEKGIDRKPLLYWQTWPTPEDLYCDGKNHCDPDKKPTRSGIAIKPYREQIREQVLALTETPKPHPPIGSGQEVRLNDVVFDHVTDHDLWYLQGQQRAFLDGQVSFPLGAMEVKAYWNDIDESQKNRYFWRKEEDGRFFGLIAFNIAVKTQSQWFWTTFEHVDNPMRCAFIPCSGAFSTISGINRTRQLGLDPSLLKILMEEGLDPQKQPGWTNYRLHGAQTDFLEPVLLGNSVLEALFTSSSSCITCHSRASRNFKGDTLSIFDDASGSTFTGRPQRSWFCDDSGKRLFLPLDYVWSLTRAQAAPNVPGPVPSADPKCVSLDWLPQ